MPIVESAYSNEVSATPGVPLTTMDLAFKSGTQSIYLASISDVAGTAQLHRDLGESSYTFSYCPSDGWIYYPDVEDGTAKIRCFDPADPTTDQVLLDTGITDTGVRQLQRYNDRLVYNYGSDYFWHDLSPLSSANLFRSGVGLGDPFPYGTNTMVARGGFSRIEAWDYNGNALYSTAGDGFNYGNRIQYDPSGDDLYVVTDGGVLRALNPSDLTGSNVLTGLPASSVFFVDFDDGYVYYTQNADLYRRQLDGGGVTELIHDGAPIMSGRFATF